MPRLRILPETCILAAAALLLIPLRYLAAVSAAVLVHELGHFLALRLLGVEVSDIVIMPGGCVMTTGAMLPEKEAICAFAGPVSGGVLMLLSRWMPLTALCACVHTVYNLLPVYPLDGGRGLRALLCMLLGEGKGGCIASMLEMLVLGLLLLVGILCCFWTDLGPLPLFVASMLCIRVLLRKIPCKS